MTQQTFKPDSLTIGVAGAGAMGSGIALAALLEGLPVLLYDVSPAILERAREYVQKHLVRKGRQDNLRLLELVTVLDEMRRAQVLIEAAPEDLELKKDLFARLDRICPPPAILATNTSTLPVTAIASACSHPERVAGMHFFNPAPVLPLVEVIRGAQSSEETVQALVELAEKLGKTPVIASDTPGFIVNRVARPFYGEALRLLGEGAASFEQIDQIVRLSGGFRMGPFELMDLIGIDVNLAAMKSMYEQTFGEPRYRPHPIQVRMVQQNRLGRKTGEGFYSYKNGQSMETQPPAGAASGSGLVLLLPGGWGPGFENLCRDAGYTLAYNLDTAPTDPAAAVFLCGQAEGLMKTLVQVERDLPEEIPVLCQCCDVTITEAATWVQCPQRLAGFDSLFFASGSAATLVASPSLTPEARAKVVAFVASLGRLSIWIQDSPGLILPRIVSMLANEAAFAVMEGVADPEVIDLAMQLGVSYPKGPLAWAREIGYAQMIAVLDHLRAEYGEDRYRTAQILRRWGRLHEFA